jgi:hypothetical protein
MRCASPSCAKLSFVNVIPITLIVILSHEKRRNLVAQVVRYVNDEDRMSRGRQLAPVMSCLVGCAAFGERRIVATMIKPNETMR